MKCQCNTEAFIHKVLPDGTYTYVCRNPKCPDYNVIKTALGEEVPNIVNNSVNNVDNYVNKNTVCECSNLIATETADTLTFGKFEKYNQEGDTVTVNCSVCGKLHTFNTNKALKSNFAS